MRPTAQWQDESTHHYRLGLHRYEDLSQHLDPAYHTLSEVERKHMDKNTVKEWRSGTEVKFQAGKEKVPIFHNQRF